MARKNPFRGVIELLKGLSGGYDVELDDEQGYDPEELAELNRNSAEGLSKLIERNGIQTLIVDDDGEEKDRLGIKKPKIKEIQQGGGKAKTTPVQEKPRGARVDTGR